MATKKETTAPQTPKTRGRKIEPELRTRRGVQEAKDRYSGVWYPATAEYWYSTSREGTLSR